MGTTGDISVRKSRVSICSGWRGKRIPTDTAVSDVLFSAKLIPHFQNGPHFESVAVLSRNIWYKKYPLNRLSMFSRARKAPFEASRVLIRKAKKHFRLSHSIFHFLSIPPGRLKCANGPGFGGQTCVKNVREISVLELLGSVQPQKPFSLPTVSILYGNCLR